MGGGDACDSGRSRFVIWEWNLDACRFGMGGIDIFCCSRTRLHKPRVQHLLATTFNKRAIAQICSVMKVQQGGKSAANLPCVLQKKTLAKIVKKCKPLIQGI